MSYKQENEEGWSSATVGPPLGRLRLEGPRTLFVVYDGGPPDPLSRAKRFPFFGSVARKGVDGENNLWHSSVLVFVSGPAAFGGGLCWVSGDPFLQIWAIWGNLRMVHQISFPPHLEVGTHALEGGGV